MKCLKCGYKWKRKRFSDYLSFLATCPKCGSKGVLRYGSFKETLIIILIIIIIILAFHYNNKPIACTEESKLCPDGSFVSRKGYDCEFESCPVSKKCIKNEDCVVFGKDGDCNCGCYNEQALPQNSGGACFCAAPTSCECINGQCEGFFKNDFLPQ